MSNNKRELFERDASGEFHPASFEAIVATARRLLRARVLRLGRITSPAESKDYFIVRLGALPYEAFAVLFLDSQHRVLAMREMFRGSLSSTSVYPREVLKEALELNAGAVVFAHNHPSGIPEPSRADEVLTQSLKSALAMVDVRVLDHLVIGGGRAVSFSERGLL